MYLSFSRSQKVLTLNEYDDKLHMFPSFSYVRNELNGERPDPSQIPDLEFSQNQDGSTGPLYMPRPFPLGAWNILYVQKTDEHWLQPFKFVTDAHQLVDIWSLTNRGQYAGPAGQQTDDWGYCIHFCNGSRHTDGCIGLNQIGDLLWLVSKLTDFPIRLESVE